MWCKQTTPTITPLATYTKRAGRWRAQICKQGIRLSKTFDRKAEAQAWAHATEAAIAAGQGVVPVPDVLAEVFARYAAEVSPTKRGARWEQIRLEALARDPLAALRIAQITPEHLGQWRDRRALTVKAGTILREITLLTAVFEHARKEWRLISVNPWRDVRKPRTPRHRERLIREDEIERICLALGFDEAEPVTTLSQQVAVMFLLAIETAMRAGELAGLTWSAIDLSARVAHLSHTKNDDARDVPLSGRAIELLGLLQGIEPARTGIESAQVFTVSPASRDALFRKARQHAGIHDLHFHDARAEACTRLAKRLDVLELARMIGHRDLKSLLSYYRATAADLAKKLA